MAEDRIVGYVTAKNIVGKKGGKMKHLYYYTMNQKLTPQCRPAVLVLATHWKYHL
jgi:hypothetical protein